MPLRGKLVGALACVALCVSAFAADVAVLRNGFNIRHQRREVRGASTRLYFDGSSQSGWIDVPTSQITSIQREEVEAPEAASSGPPAADIPELVDAASDRHQVDADFVNSVIKVESGFNPGARSPKGAQGLMQLMPETAARLGVANAWEPRDNIEGGTRYLRQLLDRYQGDIIKALAAYNAGTERVRQYQGVPPYRETRNYVRQVVVDFNRKKLAQQKTAAAKQNGKKPSKAEPVEAKQPAPQP
jgi:soluble lytic murein transglycosylase-like protein